MRIGDVIKIEGKEMNAIRDAVEQQRIAHAAFVQAAGMVQRAKENLFRCVEEAYPELNERNYTVQHDKDEIVVGSVLTKTERAMREKYNR